MQSEGPIKQAVNHLYQGRMPPVDSERLTPRHQGGPVYRATEDEDSGAVIGSVMGLNHHKAFHDQRMVAALVPGPSTNARAPAS